MKAIIQSKTDIENIQNGYTACPVYPFGANYAGLWRRERLQLYIKQLRSEGVYVLPSYIINVKLKAEPKYD